MPVLSSSRCLPGVPSAAAAPTFNSTTMLKGPVCIVPPWKELKKQIMDKLELQKGLPEMPAEGAHILLSDRPSIVFRESCFPDFMPLICFYTNNLGNYFASFTWRRGKGSKVRVWTYSTEEETPVTEKEYSLPEDPRVIIMVHVLHLHLLVAYCDDIHLRMFGDHTQDFQLLGEMSSPYSITSMCYNPENGEVVTGAIGVVAFWSFAEAPGDAPSLGVTQEVCIATGEFVHFLCVEPERRVLVALCENNIRAYDYQSKSQVRTFQVSQGVSLTCCSANWSQSFLYTGDLAGDIKVWNFDTGSQTGQFKAHLSAITSIISRTSVHTLMTASLDGRVKEWNLTTCEQLRRVDIGEELFQMQFLNEQTFFLRTKHSFSIRTINNFYQLFNRSKCELRKLARVQCGPDKARILAATNDGVIRFLSPVTGEMLFVTWPFQLLEKALDYVYDPDREELLVTMGTSDVYVLDTTKNPSPAKYILHTSDMDDKVLCLAYSRLDLAGRTSSFIFTGYKSGKVRTVTQQLYRMGARKIHDGNVVALSSISASGNLAYHSRESSYLCSYGLDEHIVLSDVLLKKNNLLEVVPLVAIASTNCRINQLLLIPGYICVLTEQNRVRLWRQASLVPGRKNPFWKETAAMHSTSITSFDYCHTLGLLVTGGSDGSVRIWDILGQLLVEFDTTLKFSRVCFANQRGDLVVGCNMNIYFISCVTYLPQRHLGLLANRHVRDEVVERPLPFLSRFLLSFDIVFVPKYRQLGRQAKKFERMEPITNHKEVVMEKDVAKVLEFMGKDVIHLPGPEFFGDTAELKEAHPEFALEYQLLRPASFEKKSVSPAEPPLAPPPYRGLPPLKDTVPLLRRIPFQGGRSWPIAPDGHVPNSVIRAQLFPKGTPETLTCPLEQTRRPLPKRKLIKIQLPEWDTSEIVEKARKKKAQRLRRGPSISEVPQRRRDLLAEIVSKPWLRHKPSDTSLPSVLRAILNLMDDVPYSTYLLCIAALVQISESYQLTASLKEQAFERLFQDTTHKEVRMRLAAWEALGKMDLLTEQEVVPLARALLDENKKVRDLSRSLLDAVAGITDKYVLKKEMQRLAETSLEDLTELILRHETAFPRRVRAAGIVAETQDEAVYALTEGAARLMNRVENQLTANLFLLSECAPEFKMPTARPPRARRRLMSLGAPEEFAKPDSHLEAQARWLGLFAQSGKPPPPDKHKGDAKEAEKAEKLPRIQQARGKMVSSASVPLPESSPSLSSLTASSSTTSSYTASGTFSSGSATWQRPKTSKEAKVREKQWAPKILTGTSREGQKLPRRRKQAQPVLLQRRDTRTQLYTEMLKFQERKVKKEQVTYATPLDLKPEASLPAKPSQLAIPGAPQPPPKGSLIDPKQQYNTDKSKWRNDLYKLMMLRTGLSIEGRTAAQDFLASARLALGGRAMSWEAFTNITRSLLAAEERVTLEPEEYWGRYMEDLFKASLQEATVSFQPSAPSMETVLAVKKGRDWPSGSETEVESSELSQEELVRGRRGVAKERVAKKKKKGLEPGALASRISAVVPKAREGGKAPEKEEKGARKAAKAGKAESRVSTRPKDQEEAQRVESEGLAKGRRPWEGAKGKEQEAVAKGREAEAARGKEPEGARGKEVEGVRGREREAAKRKEWEGAEKKEKEAPKRRLLKSADKRGPLAEGKEKEGPVEGEVLEEPLPKEARRGRKVESLLRGLGKGPLKITESTLAQMRVEAKERMMTQFKKAALVEAEKAALAEVRPRALAEAREMALAEAREWAMLQARRMTLAEAWEKVLAEAREKARQEVMGKALEEAQVLALAEVAKGEAVKEERVRELAEARAAILAEERALELAATMTLQVDEARVLELAATQLGELDEARIQELAEERAKELAKERAEELAEAKLLEMSESAILAMVEQMVEEELRSLLMEEEEWEGGKSVTWEDEGEGEGEEAGEEGEEEEGEEKEEEEVEEEKEEEEVEEEEEEEEEEGEGGADMWEDLEEEELWPLSAEETEAFLSMLEKEPAPRADLELLEQAHLVLDILTEPEKPEHSDSETFERVCQVVSLLQVASTTDAKGLGEALVRKAEEIVQEGEERQAATPEGLPSILMKLKDVVEVRQPWTANPKQFARKMKALLKAVLAVLRARNLKLGKRFGKRGWREKMEKAWVGEGGRAVGKKAWLRKKITEAVGKWKVEQEKVQQEELDRQRKEKRLQFRGKPILLGVSEREAGLEEKERKEEEAAKEEEQQRKAGGVVRRRVPRMTWSLGDQQRQRAWKAIMHLEKELPLPAQEPLQPFVPSRQRLSKGSLYVPTKPTKETRRKQLRKGGRQHVFRLEEDKGVDWERFTKLYQSLMSLKEVKGGVESAIWRVQSSKMLDLYGLSNPLIRAMVQQVLMGSLHQRRYLAGNTLMVREGQADPGQRILYELVHHSGRLGPTPAALHGIIPLSFQNNVHPFRPRGVTRFGTLAFKWKTYLSKGKVPRLRLYVHSGPT
ncbi:hypothetical protein JRQ81_012079 [Phrynocephalus forsythii]|uniref:WD repeat-containing protein 87 n=1 Tax=Phrynocephalus forsythii TaxID=171643 RepID=A0A9Q0X6X8_9SAUR|nr:hypothetical protein JRQ81_012079 [Phrynocephalus forsythii]